MKILALLLIGWLLVCMAPLAGMILWWEPGPNSDLSIIFAVSMIALTFPSGLLIPFLIFITEGAVLLPLESLPINFQGIFIWIAFVLVGFIQWMTIGNFFIRSRRS